ncbi:T-cell differentiation antigen CD6 isoform X1 [Pan troglodytes]|uniref:T-cell differentiation antigen CD6 isoform X1 n=1 Tax=Pan troglodytes TaxID=9598 RepID=UPI003013460F
MWLFFEITGLLTAALSGHPSPAPPDQLNTSSAESELWEPGERLPVRLTNGSSSCSGTVEVRLEASWEPACGALWDSRAAEAVCRALGCGGAEAASQLAPPTPELPPPPAAGNTSAAANATLAGAPAVLCSGAEWRLCEVVEHACRSDGRRARVTCAENRALRLVDGGGACAGRVEMLEHGEWGSVCDDTWDLEDAHVVCRQLGCGWGVQALPGLHFTPGRGPIHRDQVNCSGAEAYLWDCPGLPGQHYCGHKEDAGVVCSEHQSWRLTGGADRCEGQVEVHFRGVWNTVCDSEWYPSEAKVLCQSLGCGTAVERPKGLPHSLSGRMYYSCNGEEFTLSNCSWRFNNSNLCSQSLAARVLCSDSRSLHNLSTPEVPASVQTVTIESSVTVKIENKESRELMLLIPSIVLGILLLGSLIFIAFILLRIKGKYALPVMVNHQHLPTTIPAGSNSYQPVPITIPKEVFMLPIQVQAPLPEDSDSGSDSDYEHYDFSAQPPVALTTFYSECLAGLPRAHLPESGREPRGDRQIPSGIGSQMRRSSKAGSRCHPWRKDLKSCMPPTSQLPTLDTALQTRHPWALSITRGATVSRAPLRGRITAIVPKASRLHGTPRCFLQRGVPSWSSPQTWSWPAPSQPFQQGPRLMTAPAPHPGSGTRTSSHHPSPLRRSSLAVQGPPALSLTPPTTMTTMT